MHATMKGRKRAAEADASGSSQSRALVVARPQFCPLAPKFRPPLPKAQANHPRRHSAGRSPLPYPRETDGKEAQQGQGATSHASTIGQRSHSTKFVSMGMSSFICKEGQVLENVYGL